MAIYNQVSENGEGEYPVGLRVNRAYRVAAGRLAAPVG